MKLRPIILLSAVFFLSAISPCYSASGNAQVMHVQGNGQIVREDQTIDASAGMTCQLNDVLKTGSACQMDIALNKLAGCRLLASSRVSVTDTCPENMHLNVEKGNVVLNLKKLPKKSSFRVETPSAVATVRGTQFWGRVDSASPENPITTFAVREGSVDVTDKASSRTFRLEKGQALDINKISSNVPVVRDALPQEMQAMEQADSIKSE